MNKYKILIVFFDENDDGKTAFISGKITQMLKFQWVIEDIKQKKQLG